MQAPEGFAEFVAARSPALLMTARFLTDDQARAEDLVQEALARSWRSWEHIERQDRPEVYVRRVMVNLSASWWRRRWRAEVPTDVLPELPGAGDDMDAADARETVRQALAGLPARQRAVVVLRCWGVRSAR